MAIDVGEVGMIKITDIEIGDRARQEMGDVESLEGSMKEVGLAQPLCVKKCDGEYPYLLLAGERRLSVLIKNGNSQIPVRIYPENVSEVTVRMIEIAENFYRKDFEYWEYDKAIADLHSIQQDSVGKKVSTSPDAEGWGMKDTGNFIGVSKMSVSTAIKRNEAREAFPELFSTCKSQKDATKVLSRIEEASVKEALAKKIEEQKLNTTFKSIADSYILGSFFEGAKHLPEGSFNFVEIDPPYSIALAEKKKKDGESKYDLSDYNEIPPSIYIEGDDIHQWKGLLKVFQECYRLMSEHSWLICWFAPEPWFEEIFLAIEAAGFNSTRLCGIWTKATPGQTMNPTIRLANSYEMFFYAWKGKPSLAKPGRGNEFRFSPVPAQRKTHPTERPIELTTEIYQTFAFPGSRILIPFLGSGNGIFSAHDLGMSAIGFELGKSHRDSFLVKAHSKFGG